MLDSIATKISIQMKNYFTTRDDDVEVYEYMMKVFLNTFGVIFICSIVSYIFGYLGIELLVLFSVGILKFFTGGIHIKNNDICVLVSSGILLLLPVTFHFFQTLISSYLLLLILVSLASIIFNAPQGIREGKKKNMIFKLTSLIIFTTFSLIVKNEVIIFSQSIVCISLFITREKKHAK